MAANTTTYTCPKCGATSHPTSCAAEAKQLLDTHLNGQHGWVGRQESSTASSTRRR